MLTEDGLSLVLTRLETVAGREAVAKGEMRRQREEAERLRDQLQRLRAEANRANRDLKEAEAKICEWSEYAGQLRSAITTVAPNAVKKKTIVLPDQPEPFTREVPF